MDANLVDVLIPRHLPKRAKRVRLSFDFEGDKQKMTPEEFWEFCGENREVRAELTKDGEVILMPPTGFETSDRNAEIIFQLKLWAKKDKTGIATESNAGFVLPNGATRSPDAAWTRKERLEKFTTAERKKFLPLCPDFVVELRSASDTLKDLQEKMEEYIENGARLGWLIDPQNKSVYVYHPNAETEVLENPSKVSGEDVLKDFELDLTEIW
jgi:Uma2 family endonuclease